MDDQTAVEIAGLTHTFGGNRVLDGLDLCVTSPRPEEHTSAVCLIGPNGAGKSTLLNLLTGYLQPDPLAIVKVVGRSVHGMEPEEIARHGVFRSFQGAHDVVPELSILSNLMLIPSLRAVPWWTRLSRPRGWAQIVQHTKDLIEQSLSDLGCGELVEKLDAPAGELSFG